MRRDATLEIQHLLIVQPPNGMREEEERGGDQM